MSSNSSNSASSHRQARKGSESSTGNKSNQQTYHRDASRTQSRSSTSTRREGSQFSSREVRAGPHAQSSISDQEPQQEESFASNKASFGGSSHDASYTSENDSTDLQTQSYELSSQHSYSHLDHFSYDGIMLSHYDNQLTIDEDPNEQPFTYQPGVQYVATESATENDLQASNTELHALQTYSPTTEMWSLQESRDERIRLGLPGGQQTPMTSFDCDQGVFAGAQNHD
ncbi:hypothetical protein NHQ30_002130 [Ciborinia camelliae]|nr:hypothetical protein NHQ30_002130 [Ciborinia camelliae]